MKFPTYEDNAYVVKYKLMDDLGRATVTKDPADRAMWRVPTLRNLEFTAPYMHTGTVKTLPEAVRVMAATQLNKTLPDAQVDDIVAFLDGAQRAVPAADHAAAAADAG